MKNYKVFIKNGSVRTVLVCDDEFAERIKNENQDDLIVDVTDLKRRPSPADQYVDGGWIFRIDLPENQEVEEVPCECHRD